MNILSCGDYEGWCSGHLDIVQLLLRKYKADWKMTDDWGWNILHEAAVNGDKDLISCIMKVRTGLGHRLN